MRWSCDYYERRPSKDCSICDEAIVAMGIAVCNGKKAIEQKKVAIAMTEQLSCDWVRWQLFSVAMGLYYS